MIQYHTVRQTLFSAELGAYMTFGLRAQAADASELCFVPDVFPLEAQARAFARQADRLQLSPIHLRDAIDDALGI